MTRFRFRQHLSTVNSIMALSLIDLLELPSSDRTEANIILNIPSLKRKCDLFYHLTDKEAFRLLQNCELIRATTDAAIPDATRNLCILLKGKVSFCHKTYNVPTNVSTNEDAEEDKEEKDETSEKEKGGEDSTSSIKEGDDTKNEKTKVQEQPITAERRRTLVLEMVDALLEHRKSMQEESRRISIVKQEPVTNPGQRQETTTEDLAPPVVLSRTALYGKTVIQYSDGSYFGGTCGNHNVESSAKTDTFTYVADTNCAIILIPPSLQTDIVNHHYLNTIRDKESLLLSHHISRRLPKPQQSALLHEMLEQHFVHGNLLTKLGQTADSVYLIKEGFVRLYLDVKVPKDSLPEAVQHLPSTQLQQRLTTVKLEVMDLGPGEFVGGLEQLIGHKTYMFNIVTTCKTVAYNIRGQQFRDIMLKENSRTLQLFTEDMKTKWSIRREMADFALCPQTDRIISRLLGEEEDEVEKTAAAVHLQEALKSEVLLRRRSVPYYMHINVSPTEQAGEIQSLRPPNRGPFADRVRNRMIELGFKSRRGIN